MLNAVDAAEKGAEILTRTACVSAPRETAPGLSVMNERDRAKRAPSAPALVNAAGPWVTDVIGRVAGANSSRNVRLVKGSHIIVPKFWDGQQAYLVQNHDKRVIFINPYEGDLALIGTTDIPYRGARRGRRGRRERDRLPDRGREPLLQGEAAPRGRAAYPSPACGRCSTTARAIRRR